MTRLKATAAPSFLSMIWSPTASLPIPPLVKVPLLLASAAFANAGWTPPTPKAAAEEQATYGGKPSDSPRQVMIRTAAAGARVSVRIL